MKPACRCGDAWTLHCHDHGEYKTATWCARWDKCGCDRYRAPRRAETPRNALRSVLLPWTRKAMRNTVSDAHSAAQPPPGRNTP